MTEWPAKMIKRAEVTLAVDPTIDLLEFSTYPHK